MDDPAAITNSPTESLGTDRLEAFAVSSSSIQELFNRCLYSNMQDGLAFLDTRLRVTLWNRMSEQITGIRAGLMIDREWSSSGINLKDRHGRSISDANCPVRNCLASRETTHLSASLTGRSGKQVTIDLQAAPVLDHVGQIYGVVVLMQDLSNQLDLEQQVMTLYAHATRDQLTGVGNRSHFERILEARIRDFCKSGSACSLIVTDIDFFKTINDTYNHHTGDQALITFARLIQEQIGDNEVVARFGGEEFIILLPGLDADEAVQRAERIRQTIERTPLAAIEGKCLTASFGVSQIESEDTSTSVFVKADHALLHAKESGRNRVVKYHPSLLQAPDPSAAPGEPSTESQSPWKPVTGHVLASDEYVSQSPVDMMIQKLKHFVIEYDCMVVVAEPEYIQFRIEKVPGEKVRRFGDRPAPLLVDVELLPAADQRMTTRLRITIRPGRMRDRRKRNLQSQAGTLLREIQGFLMAAKDDAGPDSLQPPPNSSRYKH